MAKQGSTLAGIMDAFAISVSHGLQYGVPLEAFVDMFTNMRFEPAGMTDDPDIRFATSLVDYIFRRLAVEYLTVEERQRPRHPHGGGAARSRRCPASRRRPRRAQPASTCSRPRTGRRRHAIQAAAPAPPATAGAASPAREREVVLCYVCGDIMQRAGSCHACPSCGATSGCS